MCSHDVRGVKSACIFSFLYYLICLYCFNFAYMFFILFYCYIAPIIKTKCCVPMNGLWFALRQQSAMTTRCDISSDLNGFVWVLKCEMRLLGLSLVAVDRKVCLSAELFEYRIHFNSIYTFFKRISLLTWLCLGVCQRSSCVPVVWVSSNIFQQKC